MNNNRFFAIDLVRLLAVLLVVYAHFVSVGGGATHRLNLSDAALIKENHIAVYQKFAQNLLKGGSK